MLLLPKNAFPAASGKVEALPPMRTSGEVLSTSDEPRKMPSPAGLPESAAVKNLPVSITSTDLWAGPWPVIPKLACRPLDEG
jgi:hypothetical protein